MLGWTSEQEGGDVIRRLREATTERERWNTWPDLARFVVLSPLASDTVTMEVNLYWLWFWPLILGDCGGYFVGWIRAIASTFNPWLHFGSRSQRLCAFLQTSGAMTNRVSRFSREFDLQASDAVRIVPMWGGWICNLRTHRGSDPLFLRVLDRVDILLLILMPFYIVLIGSIWK